MLDFDLGSKTPDQTRPPMKKAKGIKEMRKAKGMKSAKGTKSTREVKCKSYSFFSKMKSEIKRPQN